MLRTKDDIEFHYDAPRMSPVVNVKVRDTWRDGYKKFRKLEPDAHPDFTEEWIDEHVSEDRMQYAWEHAIEQSWEMLGNDAEEIYGHGTKVYSCGRQGGYAYVTGGNFHPDTESWDAIEFGRWRRFAKYARLLTADVMYLVVDSLYYNYFEDWKDERSESFAPDIESALASR